MAKDIRWDYVMLADFRRLACLTDDEEKILAAWAAGWSNVKMADKFNMADRTVSRHLDAIRKKYDAVQIYSPLLPARK